MQFESVDNYLLENRGAKGDVIAGLLTARSSDPNAAPFYRALELLGTRVADEALIALRLVLAGKHAGDEEVKRLRGLVATSRAGGPEAEQARADYASQLRD